MSITCCLVAVMVASASAQEHGAGSARELFERGFRALGEDRFADAARDLQRSLDLAPRPETAYNLALALRGAGDVLGAVAQLERLLHGDYGELAPQQRAAAETLSSELTPSISRLRMFLERPSTATLRLAGEQVRRLSSDELTEIRLNPGRVSLTVESEGYADFDETLNVAPGSTLTRRFALRAVEPPSPPDERSFWESPILWTVVGVLVVGAVVAAVVVATAEQPANDPVWGRASLPLSRSD